MSLKDCPDCFTEVTGQVCECCGRSLTERDANEHDWEEFSLDFEPNFLE